jgi:uncharacterized protein (TIGR03083 family)
VAFESADDARRVIGLIRDEYRRQCQLLESLSPADWSAQSFDTDWKIYQVAAHLGSGAAIFNGTLRHALLGGPEMGDSERRAVWGRFDSLGPTEVYPVYRETNDSFMQSLERLNDQQLGSQVPWFAGGTVPLAQFLAARLSEQVYHSWDIAVVKHPSATLSAEALGDLREFILGRVEVLAKPDRAGALQGTTVRFDLTDPAGSLAIELAADGARRIDAPAGEPALRVSTATETFLRLIYGRYRPPAAPARLELDHPERLGDLIAAFPGR